MMRRSTYVILAVIFSFATASAQSAGNQDGHALREDPRRHRQKLHDHGEHRAHDHEFWHDRFSQRLLADSRRANTPVDPGSNISTRGLWVGGVSRRTGQTHVSTGSSDRVSTTTGKGFEFTSSGGLDLVQRSTLSDSRFFSEQAVSHQDFVAWYDDLVPRDSTEPDRSLPLGVRVRQESHAWNFPFADFFVIVSYTVVNATADTLDSVYVGLWANGVVRNTNTVRPGTTGYFTHGANGYMDTLRMMYTFDFDGIPRPRRPTATSGSNSSGAFRSRAAPTHRRAPCPDTTQCMALHQLKRRCRLFLPQDDAAYLERGPEPVRPARVVPSGGEDRPAPPPGRQYDDAPLHGSVVDPGCRAIR
ncbi:MAG: hypothetical protein MZV64_29680 [Ignavibacteriales bacterium]|nr:hypothetical protein [Ignavibacteriales bacterium]